MERIRQAEERSKFDIKESCFRIMDKFPKTDDPLRSQQVLSVEQIMENEDKTFVSKVILSILIMVSQFFLIHVYQQFGVTLYKIRPQYPAQPKSVRLANNVFSSV